MLYITNKDETSLDSFKRFDVDNWDELKNRITCKLSNTKLFNATHDSENILHTNKMDLTAIYVVCELSHDRKHILSYALKHEDLERIGKTEEDIIKQAHSNLKNDFNKRIKLLREDAMSHEILYPLIRIPKESMLSGGSESFIEDIHENKPNILTVTNKYNVFGASYLIDFDTLRDIHRRIKDNFYIIPMSVHKLMCVSSKYVTKNKSVYEAEDDLLDMLFEMNKENKNTEDILSYKIYKYLADDGEVLFPIKQKL
jgi:hypothetical protein